jgi:glutathione peroxidase
VSWNFNKFLIDEQGNWVAHKSSRVKPMSEEITNFAQGK